MTYLSATFREFNVIDRRQFPRGTQTFCRTAVHAGSVASLTPQDRVAEAFERSRHDRKRVEKLFAHLNLATRLVRNQL